MGWQVIRSIYPKPRQVESIEYESRSMNLLSFTRRFNEKIVVRLTVYDVSDSCLIIEDSEGLHVFEPGDTISFARVGPRLCKYHEGPKGNHLRQKWCRAVAVKGGWCSRHATSPLALYEKCVAGTDLSACKAVDAIWRDEEYIVYLLDYGSGFKIGVTRAWRFFNRVLEQPHVSVAILARVKSVYEARVLEKRFAKVFTEGMGIPRYTRMRASILSRLSIEDRARRLAYAISRLGLRGSFEAAALIAEGCPEAPLLSPSKTGVRPGKFTYVCTWGGVVVFQSGGMYISFTRDSLLHLMLT